MGYLFAKWQSAKTANNKKWNIRIFRGLGTDVFAVLEYATIITSPQLTQGIITQNQNDKRLSRCNSFL